MISKALIVCIGNELVADDAAGWWIYRRLGQDGVPPGVRLLFLACAGLSLIDTLEGENLLIVVDAVRFGAPPGKVHRLDWDRIPPAPAGAASAHGIGVREAIEIVRVLHPDRVPERVVLIGVEGLCFDCIGGEMSPEVLAGAERAVQNIRELIDEPYGWPAA